MAAPALPPMRPCRRGHPIDSLRLDRPVDRRKPEQLRTRLHWTCKQCEHEYQKHRRRDWIGTARWLVPLVDERRARAWAAAQERMARAIYEARLADGFDGRVEQRPTLGPHNYGDMR